MPAYQFRGEIPVAYFSLPCRGTGCKQSENDMKATAGCEIGNAICKYMLGKGYKENGGTERMSDSRVYDFERSQLLSLADEPVVCESKIVAVLEKAGSIDDFAHGERICGKCNISIYAQLIPESNGISTEDLKKLKNIFEPKKPKK